MATAAHEAGPQHPAWLLERELELERLDQALRSAARGQGRAALISGGAGLGKSSLLDVARERCRPLGLRVLSGRAEELEATLPWSLARQLLGPALAGAPAGRRRAVLSGAAAPAAMLLDPAGDSTSAGIEGRGLPALVHALFWAVAGITEGSPSALLVDDAHWADEPSLTLLAYLGRRLGDLPVALIVACRPGGAGASAASRDDLAGDPATEVLELAPLSASAASALARETLGATAPGDLVDACVHASGGNPFYLRELSRAVAARPNEPVRAEAVHALVPAAVARSVFLRFARLAPEAAGLARAVSVLGDGAALPRAAGLARLDLAVAAGALDQLAHAEILAKGEPLRFVHPLVGVTVHDDLPPSERADWHLRAARILDGEGVESALLAPHLLLAGARADPWVVEKLEAAAAAAAAQGGVAAAARYLERALAEPPARETRARLLAALGRLESALGVLTAPARLRAALELTASRGDERARLMFELGRALVVAGQHGEAARAFESGLGEVERDASELGRELRAAWWMAASTDPVERSRVLAMGEPEIGEGQHAPTLGQRQLLAQLAQERAFAGRPPDELRSLAQRAWGDGALLTGETSDGLSWSLVTGALLAADALEAGLEVCDAVIADARRRGSPMAYATASYCRAWPLLRRGQVADAIADAQAAVDARHDGWATFVPMAAACLALAHVERGAIDDAAAALAIADAVPGMERSNQHPMVLIAHGRVFAAQHRFESNISVARRAGELLATTGFDNPTLFPWRADAARAAALGGDLDQARALADAALHAAKPTRVPTTVAQALRVRAATGEQAIAQLRTALALLPAVPRLERIHVLLDLGAALRRANQRTEGTDALRQALALAQAGGATALADRARSELAAVGVRVTREPTSGGPQSLTPAERRVAQLAADGHANREIAQLLFLTVKTVEYHLGNTYRKLGINRRSQLARALTT